MPLKDADHFFAQVRQVALDQPRITNDATPQIVGLQSLTAAGEQLGGEGRFDFMQRLGRTGLADRHLLGCTVQRALFVERDEKAQLLEPQAGNDGGQGSDHGDDWKLSLNQKLSLGTTYGAF